MDRDVENFVYASSLISIVAAIYLFIKGKRDKAIFVALWAPTILSYAAFWNTQRPPYKE